MSDLNIKSWDAADRPREKMMLKGKSALSDAELIAILLGSGSRDESAVNLAKRILRDSGDLNRLGKWSLAQLMEYKGIGEAKAITISAALELGRRRQALSPEKRPWMRTCSDAYAIMAPYLEDLPHEEFWVILMDLKSRLISTSKLSQGGAAGVSLDVPQVFEAAISAKAKRIILCHNHPSGIPNPSQLDIELTQRLIDAGEILDIKVVDHLIVGEGKYYSFTERKVFGSEIPEN